MTGEYVIAKRDSLRCLREPHEELWQRVSDLSIPRKVNTEPGQLPPMLNTSDIHDSTLRVACLQLANGFCSLVTPREEVWHGLVPPKPLADNDAAVKFYRECSEELTYRLDESNFYDQVQELYLDRAALGTGLIFSEWDIEFDNLNFRHLPVGSFYIGEDHRGRVDCVIATMSYTAVQAATEFGLDSLPEKLKEEVKDPKKNEFHTFLVAVEKAKEWHPDQQFPFTMCAVHEESKTKVHEQGYFELPAHVTRYLRWPNNPYGYAPTWVALPEAEKLGFLQQMLDITAEKAANPPIIAPASLEGEIGIGALDITYVHDMDPNRAPREWATGSDLTDAMKRVEDKKSQIQEIMHGDLFRLFAQIERQMTATEAQLRQAERVMQFSPTFSRLTSEFLDPMLRRIFSILWRQGKMPEPPMELAIQQEDQSIVVPVPNISYNNRISLAIKSQQNTQYAEFMAIHQPMVEQDPTMLDNLDEDEQFRSGWRNAGLPEDSLRPREEVEQTREARAQAQQAAQQLAMAEQAAGIAKDAAAANGGELPAEISQMAL